MRVQRALAGPVLIDDDGLFARYAARRLECASPTLDALADRLEGLAARLDIPYSRGQSASEPHLELTWKMVKLDLGQFLLQRLVEAFDWIFVE